MSITLNNIKNIIQQGDFKTASQQLLEFVTQYSPRSQNEVIGYKAKLQQTFIDENRGIVSREEIQRQKNGIMYAMLGLIEVLEEDIGTHSNQESSKSSSQETQSLISNSNIHQLIIQQSNTGDNVAEKTMSKEKIIKIGDNANISAPIVIADSIQESFNTLAKADVNNDLKTQLDQLLKTINEISKKATPEQTEITQRMAQDAETLVKEAASSNPRRRWYELSLEGLKEAATGIGEIASPVLKIIKEISPLLLP
jgi:hypothetical protein